MQTHHQIQHADHHHGHEEEADSGDLHDHVVDPYGLQHSADGWLGHPLRKVEEAVQRCVGDSTDHGHHPDDADYPFDVLVRWQVPGFKWVQNSNVPFNTQSGDVEDGGEAHGLQEEGLEVAAALPERERIILPQFVDLQGHPEQEHEQVWQSQAQQVQVGGVSHFLVPRHHCAREQVSRQADEEDEQVDTGHGEKKGRAFRTKNFNKVGF